MEVAILLFYLIVLNNIMFMNFKVEELLLTETRGVKWNTFVTDKANKLQGTQNTTILTAQILYTDENAFKAIQ